jgi:hypothetical protein
MGFLWGGVDWDVGVVSNVGAVERRGCANGFSKGAGFVVCGLLSIWGIVWRSCCGEPLDRRCDREAGLRRPGPMLPFVVGTAKKKGMKNAKLGQCGKWRAPRRYSNTAVVTVYTRTCK